MSKDALYVKVCIDGGARGNPGPAGAGVVISDLKDGQIIYEGGLYIGRATNNVAEYKGLLHGLEMAARLGAAEVRIVSDSELLVKQMTGQYRVKNEGLRPLYEKAQELAGNFDHCGYRHVKREENKEADRLVNQAIDLKRNVEGAAGQ